ncbi:hypothetical protein [Streptomyces sp. CAU 1734]|uniref:hypothetical protein n=1 Tax=Streptomyces sp. CAU 1734 TaxID=3140360 RepID=UPI003260A1B4
MSALVADGGLRAVSPEIGESVRKSIADACRDDDCGALRRLPDELVISIGSACGIDLSDVVVRCVDHVGHLAPHAGEIAEIGGVHMWE